MDQPLDAGFLRRHDESLCVLHGPIKADFPPGKADPVGIIEGGCPQQGLPEFPWLIEIEGEGLDLVAERAFPVWVPGDGYDLFPHREEPAGYVFAGVAIGPRDHDKLP